MKKTKNTQFSRNHKPKNKQTHKKKSLVKFIPALVITFIAIFIWSQPNFSLNKSDSNVLAYATNISQAGLLTATNSQRSSNGVSSLSLNAKLNSAAQAKANDMINRNYWSHQTPDGQQPWVFISNAGYQYLAAGENLAYGFSTSDATVVGWMNSPSHKANLLNTTYNEVGFGMANGSNYINQGQQTVVVAMYAKSATSPVPTSPTPSTTTPKVQSNQTKPTQKTEPVAQSQPVQSAPLEEQKKEDNIPKKEKLVNNPDTEEPVTVYADANEASGKHSSREIARINILTNGAAKWSAALIVLLVITLGFVWSIHRGLRLVSLIKNGFHAVGKNIHIDLAVLAFIFLAYVLLSTSGYIK